MANPNMIITCSSNHKPLMLKDYLVRDDFSSCSSNGFKSFPRRQCCTTVRFLLDIDLKARDSGKTTSKQQQRRRRRRRRRSTTSVLQKASAALIRAVKLLPFSPSVKSPSPSLLPRRLSRKLFRKNFWRRGAEVEEKEIGRWRLFREFLNEQDDPSDRDKHHHSSAVATEGIAGGVSTSSSSHSDSKSNSWAESEFTAGYSGNSKGCGSQNDVLESELTMKKKKKKKKVEDKIGVAKGDDSSVAYSAVTTKEWPNEEKEQFSPVSVLDCPFEEEEEEEETLSTFQYGLVPKGSKQKQMQKLRRFQNLAHIKPLDLEKLIESANPSNDESLRTSNDDKENGAEKEAHKLLNELKKLAATEPSHCLVSKAPECMLLDFFREEILGINGSGSTVEAAVSGKREECLKAAIDWMNGEPQETFLGWEVKDGRHVYIRDMERKSGKWRSFDEEKEEVALELELEVFTCLLHEALLDIF